MLLVSPLSRERDGSGSERGLRRLYGDGDERRGYGAGSGFWGAEKLRVGIAVTAAAAAAGGLCVCVKGGGGSLIVTWPQRAAGTGPAPFCSGLKEGLVCGNAWGVCGGVGHTRWGGASSLSSRFWGATDGGNVPIGGLKSPDVCEAQSVSDMSRETIEPSCEEAVYLSPTTKELSAV